MIDGRNSFDQPVKTDLRANDNIGKIGTCQGDDYTDRCLLDYHYLEKYYKLTAIDLSKQKNLDAESKALQQIILLGI